MSKRNNTKPDMYEDLPEDEKRRVDEIAGELQNIPKRAINPKDLNESNTAHLRWDPAWEDEAWPEHHNGIMLWVEEEADGNKIIAYYLHLEMNVQPTIELEAAFRKAMTDYLESGEKSKGKDLEEAFFGPVRTGAGNFRVRWKRKENLFLWFVRLDGKPKGISAERYLTQKYGDELSETELSITSILRYYRDYKSGK